jgi:hypothetical protein
MTADRLRLDLAELADEAIQIDLHDRVLTFSRRLGIQRAVAGSAAVLALVAAASGAAFAVLPDRAAPPMPPAASTPSASVTAEPTAEPSFDPSLEPTETTTPAVTEPPTLILGPDGLGALKLGMSKEQAAATGAVGAFDGRQGCQFASLAGSARDEAWAMHDPGLGIAAIEVPKGIRTVNGLEVGPRWPSCWGSTRMCRRPSPVIRSTRAVVCCSRCQGTPRRATGSRCTSGR